MIYENKENCLVFSHTNKAVGNIKNRLKKIMDSDKINKICHTFKSFFHEDIIGVDDLKDKIVFVDEYSMTPNHFITLLYKAFTKYDITIAMRGCQLTLVWLANITLKDCQPTDSLARRSFVFMLNW